MLPHERISGIENPAGIELAPGVRAPESAMRWQYARSSGPGGQNVNKVNTKAELWLPITAITGLSDRPAHACKPRPVNDSSPTANFTLPPTPTVRRKPTVSRSSNVFASYSSPPCMSQNPAEKPSHRAGLASDASIPRNTDPKSNRAVRAVSDVYFSFRVKPTFNVTCQCPTFPPTISPRVSVTSNHRKSRNVFDAPPVPS